jgi:uncharacterized protein
VRAWSLLLLVGCVPLVGCTWFGGSTLEAHCQRGGDGAGHACWKAGEQRAEGTLVEKDLDKARSLWERGCEMGEGQACLALAVAYGEGRFGPRDDAAKERWMARGCQAGAANACIDWARILEARGDEDAVRAAWERACALGDDGACNKVDGVDD